MAVDSTPARLEDATLGRIQETLRKRGLSGWLLYDFHGINPISQSILGLGSLSRRYFVWIPVEGRAVALTHRIEQQVWSEWTGERRVYLSWREMEEELAGLVRGAGRVAMEYSPFDAVPYLDRVPAGVVELVRRCGAEVVSSADLVTAFHARWSAEGLEQHRRAARIVRDQVFRTFAAIGEAAAAGSPLRELEALERMRAGLREAGLTQGPDGIVALGPNAADPHYRPSPGRADELTAENVVLIDCWGSEPDGIAADQTWIGYLGEEIPERVREVWSAVRDAREAAVRRVRDGWDAKRGVHGAEVDDAARELIRERGFGDYFIHRTGHSIDREMHGSGPNLDNLETADGRALIEGIGFSVEPGVYIPDVVGMRSEVNVYISSDGPEVTTPDPQHEIHRIAG